MQQTAAARVGETGTKWAARRGAWLLLSSVCAAGCGIGIARDLSNTPPREVIYDDLCGVQEYHDTLLLKKAEPPGVSNTNELESTEGKRRSGGRTTFAFETPFQLQVLRRVLEQNWARVPDEIMKAPRVEVEVRWSEKAGVRRVVTTEDARIGTGDGTQALPYHICLSELLFGGPLYQTRRQLLGLSPIATSNRTGLPATTPAVVAPQQNPVQAAPDAGASDAQAPLTQ